MYPYIIQMQGNCSMPPMKTFPLHDFNRKEERIYKNLEQILTAGLRARDLVRQILIFSRQTEIELKPLQLTSGAGRKININPIVAKVGWTHSNQ